MNKGNKLSKIVHLITMGGLALLMAIACNGTLAWADMHTIPVAAAGLAYGESLRPSLANTSTRTITVVASTLDANGGLVKQASLVVPPGQILTFNTSRSEAGGDEQSKQLRTQVTVQNGDDANDLLVSSQVVDESTGSSKVQAVVDRLAANHNETLVRDMTPTASASN